MRSTQRFSYRKGGADSACRRRKHAGGKRSARLLRVERLEERMVLSAGVVLTSIGPYSSASASFLDNDRIVVAGESSYDFAVLRYQADGTLDPSFGGTDGIVTTSFKYHAGARAVAPTPDGQIVVGGYASGRNVSVDYDFAVARYNDEGTLDSSFGTSGTVQTSIDHSDHLTDVVVLDDGSIIAAGASKTGVYHATLVGYTPTGRLDNNFGDRGIVQTVLGDQGDGIVDATIHHGKILAAANASFSDDPDASFALVRYNLDGTLDDTFGDGGKVISHFQGIHASAAAVAVNTDQSIVVVGGVVDPETDHFYFAAAHYDSGGNLDTSFGTDGTGGLAVTEFGEDSYPGVAVSSVAIQEDGKIVVAGTVHPGSGQSTFFGVVRYNNDGTLDTGFGQDLDNDGTPDGKLLTPIPYRAQCSSVVIQSDGKIVVSGTAFDTNGSFIALARYDSYGTLDNTFGSGITVTPTSGLVTTEDGGQDSFTVVLDSQPTGDVTILISSSDETEGTVSPSSLTFTTDNWDTPQTVTATGLDDNEVDGGVGYTILVGPASSDDLTYSNMDPADVSVTNSDNDTQYVGTMHVADLSGTVRYAGPSWKALVTITVVDQAGNPVPNATVNGAWSEDISGYVAVLTGSNGQATATSGKIANSINSVIFTVETIVHESFDYAPTDNIETSIRVYQNGLTESLIAAAGQYQSVVLEPLTATGTTSWTQERAAVEPLFIEQHTASAEEAAPDDPVSSASVDQAITELDLDPLDDGLLEDLALAVL